VLWTPPALPESYYREVANEIAAGGSEALHHHLLHLDLGGFTEHSKPPMTRAKQDLVELTMDSTERFWRAWTADDLPLPLGPCRSEDLYSAYRCWCSREGIGKPAQKQTLLTAVGKKPDADKRVARYEANGGGGRSTVVVPAYMRPESGESERLWLGRHITDFAGAVQEYREGVNA
jgi:putative DNA primase/helicase